MNDGFRKSLAGKVPFRVERIYLNNLTFPYSIRRLSSSAMLEKDGKR